MRRWGSCSSARCPCRVVKKALEGFKPVESGLLPSYPNLARLPTTAFTSGPSLQTTHEWIIETCKSYGCSRSAKSHPVELFLRNRDSHHCLLPNLLLVETLFRRGIHFVEEFNQRKRSLQPQIVQSLRRGVHSIVMNAIREGGPAISSMKSANQGADSGKNTFPASISGVTACARETLSESALTGITGRVDNALSSWMRLWPLARSSMNHSVGDLGFVAIFPLSLSPSSKVSVWNW
jgi:hypothetical protein